MNYLQEFSEYYSINEAKSLSGWRRIFNKIKKDLNLNFYFISTFGMGIAVFYPVIDNLIQNHKLNMELSKENIVMLTICAIGILINENKESINKLKEKLKEKNLLGLLDNIVDSLKSIKNILIKIFLKLGKTLTTGGGFLDLLAYTSLLVPAMKILNQLIIENGIDFSQLNDIVSTMGHGIGLSVAVSVGSLLAKQFLTNLFNRVKKLIGWQGETELKPVSEKMIEKRIKSFDLFSS